jgi:hypothetical protein
MGRENGPVPVLGIGLKINLAGRVRIADGWQLARLESESKAFSEAPRTAVISSDPELTRRDGLISDGLHRFYDLVGQAVLLFPQQKLCVLAPFRARRASLPQVRDQQEKREPHVC